jgi:glycosyltransferase involved in cell wall biosynthesis
MSPPHARSTESEFADLLSTRRLVIVPGFLSTENYQTALTAMDIVCTPYPRFMGLSASLLEAVSAGRPVLANDSGWMRAMVHQFGLGWTCDVLNGPELSSAIRTAFDTCSGFVETPAIDQLMRFNSPANYAMNWAQGLSGGREIPAQMPWSEVAAVSGWHRVQG